MSRFKQDGTPARVVFGVGALLLVAACLPAPSGARGDEPPAQKASAQVPPGARFGFADVLEPALAAVVHVTATKRNSASEERAAVPFYERRFGAPEAEGRTRGRETDVLGSGVIVRADGIVLTNHHVVADSSRVIVTLTDGRQVPAAVVGSDAKTDLAVLKLELRDLPVLGFGVSSTLRVGDVVFAIGDPFRVGQSATMGIVSALGRTDLGIVGDGGYEDFIQTDASINPGNSGGALVDSTGLLVGINTAIFARGAAVNQGIGFAIPSDMALRVMGQILETGHVTRAWLGITLAALTPAQAGRIGLDRPAGAMVVSVLANTPADRAGLRRDDVLTTLDGSRIAGDQQFRLDVSSRRPGSRVRLGILRNGEERELTALLAELPEADDVAESRPQSEPPAVAAGGWGLSLTDPSPAERAAANVPASSGGALVSKVEEGSVAARAGLVQGDLILELDRARVSDAGAVRRQLARRLPSDGLLALVRREGQDLLVVLEP